jgi:tyrosine-protein kinase Etk/Wzc
MDVYILYGLDNKNQTADSTIKFIDGQLKVILDSLDVAEKKLEKFRLKNSFIDLSSEGTLIQNRLEKFENEKTAFELQLQYYNYLSEYLNIKNAGGTIISPSVMGITDQVLIRLVNELSASERNGKNRVSILRVNQPALELMYNKLKKHAKP